MLLTSKLHILIRRNGRLVTLMLSVDAKYLAGGTMAKKFAAADSNEEN